MFNRNDINNEPNTLIMSEYIDNNLWDQFINFMEIQYDLKPIFEFSKCSMEYGWNVKFKKGSKSICTVYPRENYFTIMLVVSNKQKEVFDSIFNTLDSSIKDVYLNTKEFNGQRWLMIDLEDNDNKYNSIKKIINMRINNK